MAGATPKEQGPDQVSSTDGTELGRAPARVLSRAPGAEAVSGGLRLTSGRWPPFGAQRDWEEDGFADSCMQTHKALDTRPSCETASWAKVQAPELRPLCTKWG